MALGAYDITPLEAAGAYTMFANHGEYVKPSFISLIRDDKGKPVFRNKAESKQVLDPRVAYLMTNLMQEVLRTGTAAGVRAQLQPELPGGGQDRDVARWLVRRLHFGVALHSVGGLRRRAANSIWKARTQRRPSGPSS